MKKSNKYLAKILTTLLLTFFLINPILVQALPVPDLSSFSGDTTPPVPTSDAAVRGKEVGLTVFGITVPGLTLDSLVITIGREAVDKISDEIINWINDTGGDQKGPLFITDPVEFFADIAESVGGEFIKSAGLEALCSPFQVQVKTALTTTLKSTVGRDPDDRYDCSLKDVATNIDAFLNGNFAEGGWPAWFELTQKPLNNPYGAFLETEADLGFRIASAKGTAKLEADWAKGFLSLKGDCVQWETTAELYDDNGNFLGSDNRCVKYGPTKTPGSVIEQQLEKTIGSELDQLNLADEFDEVFGALMGKLMGQILNRNEGIFTNNSVEWAGTGRGRTTPPNPIGSCRSNPYQAVKGTPVTWTLTTNATQNATFAWGGDEGLTGSGKTLTWTYNIPSPPAKLAWVDITDTQMVNGSPVTTTKRVDCNTSGQVLVIDKYEPITGTCIAADYQTGAQIYNIDNLKYMSWVVTDIKGGSGNYISYTWDGTEPKVNTGNGSGALTFGSSGKIAAYTPLWAPTPNIPTGEFFTFFPFTLPSANAPGLTDPKKFIRWYMHGGTKTAEVTVIDADRQNNTNAVGIIDCPTDRTVPFRVVEVIQIP